MMPGDSKVQRETHTVRAREDWQRTGKERRERGEVEGRGQEGVKRKGGEWAMAKWQRRRRKRRGHLGVNIQRFCHKGKRQALCSTESTPNLY